MGGRGSLLAAFLGLLVGVAGVAAIGVPLVSVASASSPTSFYAVQQAALVTGAAFVGVFLAPAIAVELSHTGVVGEALNGPKATLSFAPVAGGGMLSGGIRF